MTRWNKILNTHPTLWGVLIVSIIDISLVTLLILVVRWLLGVVGVI